MGKLGRCPFYSITIQQVSHRHYQGLPKGLTFIFINREIDGIINKQRIGLSEQHLLLKGTNKELKW
jgi:hypothetical protein